MEEWVERTGKEERRHMSILRRRRSRSKSRRLKMDKLRMMLPWISPDSPRYSLLVIFAVN